MRRCRRHLAIAFALGSLVAACGGADAEPRQPNPRPFASSRPIVPENDFGSTPQNMPGGGRGSDPPHFKGKP